MIEIIMPKAGMDMQEGEILEWKIEEGEYIEKGAILLEIMTDKVNMEVEAEESGYLLKKVYNNGDTVPVITTIGYIGEKGEVVPDTAASDSAAAPQEKSAEANVADVQSAQAQPAASNDARPAASKAAAKSSEKEVFTPFDGYDYDLAVIGGGPAGYEGAIKAAMLGARVTLVEKDELGGTCLNRGCIPAKTYVKNSEIIDLVAEAAHRGIGFKDASFDLDLKKAVAYKNDVVKKLTGGVGFLLKSHGVKVFKGIGSIDKDKNVYIDGEKKFNAARILLAGGSKASRINIKGIESSKVVTSDEMLDLDYVPNKLCVIGAGVIGLELGMVFNSYGSEVTVIEMMDRTLPNMDEAVSAQIEQSLKKKGLNFVLGASLKEIREDGDSLTMITDKGEFKADLALLSIGRAPDLSAVEGLDIELDRNRVKVNEFMETSIKGVYAPGDMNGKRMLAHAAFAMSEAAVENALFSNKHRVNLDHIPSAVYTSPEVGAIGLTEADAKGKYDIAVGKFNFASNGRALAAGEGVGFVKVIIDKKYGEILGVHIVGPQASELVNEAAALMANEITVQEAIKVVHGHPTFGEALFEALCDSVGAAVHLPKKK